MKKVETIAIIVLSIIAVVCISIFLYQFFVSGGDAPKDSKPITGTNQTLKENNNFVDITSNNLSNYTNDNSDLDITKYNCEENSLNTSDSSDLDITYKGNNN